MSKKSYRPEFSSTSDPRVLRTREQLRRALLSLLETRSLDELTIPEIAITAGIGRTSFFRHYPSKEALLEEIATSEIQHMVALSMAALSADDTQQAALTICDYVDQHRKLWTTLLTGGAGGALKEEFILLAQQVTAETESQSSWLPADAGIVFVVSSIVELLRWWLQQTDPITSEKMAVILRRAVLTAIYED